MTSIEEKLQKELEKLPDSWIILLEVSPDNLHQATTQTIKILTDKGQKGIILSSSKPCTNLLDTYESADIDLDDVFLLDTLCKTQTNKPPEKDGVYHLDSPSSLTNISLALNETINSIDGEKFFFLDSVPTMLIHNNPPVFSRFIHSIMTRMRMTNTNAIIVTTPENTDKKVRAEIAQLCDRVIKL